ncbi:MAG: hypothetical protein ACM3XM_03990 [Mycobacterium leprae]
MTRWAKRFALPIMLLCLVLIGMGRVVVPFWGNPWVRLTMGWRVSNYLSERYPETRFELTDTGYDFANQGYVAHVRSKTVPAVEAIVVLSQDGKSRDDYLERKLKTEMVAQLKPVVQLVLPGATVSAEIRLPDGSKYGEGMTYGPEVGGEMRAVITWELSSADPTLFVEQVTAVLVTVRQSGLRVDGCLFWGNLGDRSYALNLTKAEMVFTSEQLLPLVTKPGKW